MENFFNKNFHHDNLKNDRAIKKSQTTNSWKDIFA